MSVENVLLLLVFLPLVVGLVNFFLSTNFAKYLTFGMSLVGFGFAIWLFRTFESSASHFPLFSFSVPWLALYRVQFSLYVDGLSLPLVLLTKGMMPIALLSSWNEERRVKALLFCYLLLDTAMTGTFLANDLFLFYVFWELMLVPMILLIGVWGSTERVYAALKFFLFTFTGSIFMLVGIFVVLLTYHAQFGYFSSDIAELSKVALGTTPLFWGLSQQSWVFLAFTVAFLIKVPVFPLHTWLPDAHVQAPTGGSILLAAVLLKMGTYGLLRFSIPFCPEAFLQFAPLIATLAIIGIVYGAWVAFQQSDMKKLVAYSSVSHLGFVVLGICALNPEGLNGAMLQMINHGLSTGALFFLVGVLYERRHTRMFSEYGGLAKVVPWFAVVLVFIVCSSMGVPGLNGFIGEFLVLLGAFKRDPVWAGIAVTGVIFGATYSLWMVKQVLWGPVSNSQNQLLKDLSVREWLALVPLILCILWLGVRPKPFMDKFSPYVDSYWARIEKAR